MPGLFPSRCEMQKNHPARLLHVVCACPRQVFVLRSVCLQVTRRFTENIKQLPWLCCAQVPCSHAVALAKARLEEDPSGGTQMLREFANISESNAEQMVHVFFRRAGLAANVPISVVNVGNNSELSKWPFVKFSDWIRHLIDTNRLARQLCGVRTTSEMRERLVIFWDRFKALHPTHEVFQRSSCGQLDLSSAIPVWSHTDEGRTQKKLAMLVLSVHGCLGRGTSQYLEEVAKDPSKRDGMGLNFVGSSWSTQFLCSVMMRTVYNKHPSALDKLVEAFADDMHECAFKGVRGTVNPRQVFYAVQLGTKGDLPALVKLGSFKRSFNRVQKTSSAASRCQGICHWCDAGMEGQDLQNQYIMFEDLSDNPDWLRSLFVALPWDAEPAMLKGQLFEPNKGTFFFRLDIWHNFHCGVAKVFLASSFIVLCNLGVIAGSSVDLRFKALSEFYRDFCQRHKLAMHVQEFTRDNLGFDSEASWPVGKWNKGAASTHMMLFLQSFMETRVLGNTDDPLLLSIATRLCSCSL